MNYKAFTLAEILITLSIIGIIAALTLPVIIANHRKNIVELRLKRVYSILGNAMAFAVKDNGASKEWATASSSEFIKTYLEPYLPGSSFVSESKLAKMFVYTKEGSEIKLNAGYSSALKLKTGELIRVANGFNPAGNPPRVQISFIIQENKSNLYFIGKDYFTFYYNIDKDAIVWQDMLSYGYTCESSKDLLIERCGSYGAESACMAMIICNGWKIPDYYPIKL